MRYLSLNIILSFLCMVAASHSWATSYVMMSDEALSSQADYIIEGEVLGIVTDRYPGKRNSTFYNVKIIDSIKGDFVEENIVVAVIGNSNAKPGKPFIKIFGAPEFQDGQHVLLFLNKHPKGYFKLTQSFLGAFHERQQVDGQLYWHRELSQAHELTVPGQPQPNKDLENQQRRDKNEFKQWLKTQSKQKKNNLPTVDSKQSSEAANYWFEASSSDTKGTFEKYAFTTLGVRWNNFDNSQAVNWLTHQSGLTELSGGGVIQFQAALSAWNANPGSNIQYEYTGTTTASSGFTSSDNSNTILFNDPNNEISGSFSCASGGVLAIGGYWGISSHNFENNNYATVIEGDIITQDGAGCFLAANSGKNGDEVFAHELGHTLGLGHSCGDSNSGSCNTTDKDEALMRASAHGDGRGAQLGNDDIGAANFLYGTTEIEITGNNQAISTGDNSPNVSDHTEFGTVDIDTGLVNRTFTIINTGSRSLSLTSVPAVVIGGTNQSDFNVTTFPATSVAIGGATTFTISFDPAVVGERTAIITIANNDNDENNYVFAISGSGSQSTSVTDADGDGILDSWEIGQGLNPNDAADASEDIDNDGLTNLQEFLYSLDPKDTDTDDDGLSDGYEISQGFDPTDGIQCPRYICRNSLNFWGIVLTQ